MACSSSLRVLSMQCAAPSTYNAKWQIETPPCRPTGPSSSAWGSHDRDLADIFALQDEITEAVTIAVAPAVAEAEQQGPGR